MEHILKDPPPTRRRLNVGSAIVFMGLILMVGIMGLQLANRNLTQPTSGIAPDFTITTFAGENFRLADQQSQIVIVNFWASWCLPCQEEAPILQGLWERYREEGVVVVGIAYLDTESDARAFLNEFNITYPNGMDIGTEISSDYRIQGVPETFVIDREGNIAGFFIAPIQEGQLDPLIEKLK